jgi:hypothetical protein
MRTGGNSRSRCLDSLITTEIAARKLSYPGAQNGAAFEAVGLLQFLVWRFGVKPWWNEWREAVMASISEIERAKMITSLASAIGNEEANVLATALNLDGQLATRDELRVTEMGIRNAMQDLKDELKADFRSEIGSLRSEFTTEVRRQTRQLFVALLTVVATIFGLIAGLLGLTGKL